MTVNERLVLCGAIDQWDDAVRRRDRERMVAVLGSVAMTPEQAAQTADAVLANPQRYGF
jgi:hypothetical protein